MNGAGSNDVMLTYVYWNLEAELMQVERLSGQGLFKRQINVVDVAHDKGKR